MTLIAPTPAFMPNVPRRVAHLYLDTLGFGAGSRGKMSTRFGGVLQKEGVREETANFGTFFIIQKGGRPRMEKNGRWHSQLYPIYPQGNNSPTMAKWVVRLGEGEVSTSS